MHQFMNNMDFSDQLATVIISAYNEEKTISGIIAQILQSSEVDEIIVINDGSSDSTLFALQVYSDTKQLKIINYPRNRGKGFAMASGILQAKNEILLFIDADLINFEVKFVSQLLYPLKSGKANMAIGQPTNNFFDFNFNPFISIAGERAVFRSDILPLVPKMFDSRFGVETLINLFFKANNLTIIYVCLLGLKHPIKTQKYTMGKSLIEYSTAGIQIFKTIILNYFLTCIIAKNIFIKVFK